MLSRKCLGNYIGMPQNKKYKKINIFLVLSLIKFHVYNIPISIIYVMYTNVQQGKYNL